jgi:hypothetical protein
MGVKINQPHQRKEIHMNVKELNEKVIKAEEAVIKAEKTIDRHKAQAEKKLKIIRDNGWDMDNARKYAQCGNDDAWWTITDYQHKLDDIKNATEKLEDKKRILQNWKERLEVVESKEQKFLTEVPESMKEMMNELVARWDKYDLEEKELLKSKYNELGYSEFVKQYKLRKYNFMRYETEESIHKANVRSAEAYVMDLYNRIHLITGEVTDWSEIYCAGVALNGFVKGQLGAVRIETILAGGYNIQRLHCRTLVHEVR